MTDDRKKRVMMLPGKSLPLTLAVALLQDAERYGTGVVQITHDKDGVTAEPIPPTDFLKGRQTDDQ